MHHVVAAAEQTARRAHRRRFDKAGFDDFEHLATVAAGIAADRHPPITVAAGWLHHVLEDTDETVETLRAVGFPDELITIVVVVTRCDGESVDDYYDRIISDADAVVVKRFDVASSMDPARLVLLPGSARVRLATDVDAARRLRSAC